MNKTLIKYFLSHFKKLEIKKNDNLLIYSDLSKFGIINKQIPKIIIKCLKSVVSSNGTIVMPFYNFNTSRDFVYEKKKFDYSSIIGSLNKEFSKEKKIIRSSCIIHNHIGLGRLAYILEKSNENSSLGKGSDFELFKEYDFKLVLLGCSPMQGATYLHHLEALHNVPYREWITLKRKKQGEENTVTVSINYYANKNNNFIADFNSVFQTIKNNSSFLVETSVKYGKSYAIKIRDLDKIGSNILKKNNYSFVKKIK